MKEIKCEHCKRVLGLIVDNEYRIHGYYLFTDKAYCTDCWGNRETGQVVLARSSRTAEGKEKTASLLIKSPKGWSVGVVRPKV
jgi:hypothetical protein